MTARLAEKAPLFIKMNNVITDQGIIKTAARA